jgi:D-amino-acid dehydrogenase
MASERPAPVKTALVIGGGVIGTACAVNLQARGIATRIVDPVSIRRAASWGNAGHIAVEQVEPLASFATLRSLPARLFSRGGALGLPLRDIGAWLPFSLRLIAASRPNRFAAGKQALSGALAAATEAWRRLLGSANASHLLLEQGHFVVWESIETAEAGRAAWEKADTGTARFRGASAEEMSMLCGLVKRPLAGAIRFLGTGQIVDLAMLAVALDSALVRLGGAQHCGSAAELRLAEGMASVILDTGETLHADAVVVAAGVGSDRLLEPFGYKVPLIAERGYHVQSPATDWPVDLPPVVFEDRSMIATRFRTGLRVASFVEFSRSDSSPDPRKWRRLRRHVEELGLSLGEPVAEWIGGRPTLPDYLPAIGASRRASKLFYAFGHQHLGLTLAAVTGEAIAALVVGDEPAIEVTAFDLERFQRKQC